VLRLRSLHRSNGSYYLMTTRAGGADPDGFVEPDGRWMGSLAEGLAIRDAIVDQVGLVAAFRGLDPTDRQPLDPRHGRVSVAAIDCVFAAPKSVSVLHALGSDPVGAIVRDAHDRAVEAVLGYLERNASFVRRRGNLVQSRGLLAAAFVHRTSRAPDPHLHTHLLVANLGADDAGRWSAIDGRPIYAQAGAAGSLYRAGLRREISDHLDISWERRVEGFADLIGISKAALRGFSQRSDEIEAELRDANRWSRRSQEVAADRTRSAKQIAISYEALVRQWRERALDLGVARSTLTRLSTPTRRGPQVARNPNAEVVGAVETSMATFDRPFTKSELVRASSARLVDGAPVDAVETAVDAELEMAPLIRAEGRVAFFTGSRSGRFPSGVVEARYMSTEVARLVRQRDDGLGALAGTHAALDATSARSFEVGGRVLPPTTAVYEFVRAAATAADRDGRRVLALAASRIGAAHLEALTGIEPETWKAASTIPDGAFVVIDDPGFTPIRGTAELVELARSGRVGAVFLDRRAERTPLERDPALSGHPGGCARFDADGVRVVVAPDLRRLASETRRLRGVARAAGREPLVVSARPDSIADLVGRTIDPARLRRALDRHGPAEVIAVGAAPVLARALDDVPEQRRTHLVVSPVRLDRDGHAAALGIAEPRDLRRALGRFPLGSRERSQWIVRSAAIDRARALDRSRSLECLLQDRARHRSRAIGRDL
jgi:conjugative relaxase-like TrwC/TraI family protein